MKTIENWREDLHDAFCKHANDAAKLMAEMSEEIVIAFCAKYGLQPNEIVLCYQGNKFWVEKKDDNQTKCNCQSSALKENRE